MISARPIIHAAGNTHRPTSSPGDPADLARVDLDSAAELGYWLGYFHTTQTRLHEAVSLMGRDISRVRAYLRRLR